MMELIVTASGAVALHLLGTIWWASRLTTRMDHVERWVVRHEQVEARLAALERGMAGLQGATGRIEAILMGKERG
ncbi:MAG: hypothetical protein Alpg2KO_06930 [Alphaproteobacteria bacterium]